MIAIVLAAALAAAPQGSPCKPQFAPLTTGMYAGSSTPPIWPKATAGQWAGTGWVGWSWDSTTLQPVQLAVRSQPKEPGGIDEVSVEVRPEVIFAVRCVPSVTPGPMRSTSVMNESLLQVKSLAIPLGARRYELRLDSSRPTLSDARVTLSDGQRTQVLFSADGIADDPHLDVVWAGDIDRDGQLDLVVNFSKKYSIHPYTLLLSSRAAVGQIVGEVAVFTTTD